jgi:hypothetical protein
MASRPPAAAYRYLLTTLQIWGLCIGLIQAAPTSTEAFTDTLYLWMVSAGGRTPGSCRDADGTLTRLEAGSHVTLVAAWHTVQQQLSVYCPNKPH